MTTPTHTTEPTKELKELVDRVGQTRAGELIGLKKQSINEMIRTGRCRPAYNLAASAILGRLQKPKPHRLYFVRVPPDRAELFQEVVSGLGFKYRTFTDE